MVRLDPGRAAAQIITGIGFLGAGVIINEGFNVRGLTTAACLWMVAGIGMSFGMGRLQNRDPLKKSRDILHADLVEELVREYLPQLT